MTTDTVRKIRQSQLSHSFVRDNSLPLLMTNTQHLNDLLQCHMDLSRLEATWVNWYFYIYILGRQCVLRQVNLVKK